MATKNSEEAVEVEQAYTIKTVYIDEFNTKAETVELHESTCDYPNCGYDVISANRSKFTNPKTSKLMSYSDLPASEKRAVDNVLAEHKSLHAPLIRRKVTEEGLTI